MAGAAVVDFSKILTTKFRWPEAGDRLFKVSDKPSDDAKLAGDWFTRMVLMAEGYKRAADSLVTETKCSLYLRDTLVYPIVFCYRHYLELELKAMIALYGRPVGIEPNWKDHRLDVLWANFKKILEHYHIESHDAANEVVEKCILEFSEIDENSFSFRYPTTRTGKPIKFDKDHFDLEVLEDVMKGIAGFFSGSDGYLSNIEG